MHVSILSICSIDSWSLKGHDLNDVTGPWKSHEWDKAKNPSKADAVNYAESEYGCWCVWFVSIYWTAK